MYADVITKSMEQAIKEVVRRRKIQIEYNKKHGITPKTIEKAIRAKLVEKEEKEQEQSIDFLLQMSKKEVLLPDEKEKLIRRLRQEMLQAAKDLDFETAAILRDRIKYLKASN